MEEYIVTLRNHEDLKSFYEDMETPGGTLYIPDRCVDVVHKRPISRNTHYLLTEEEAETIKEDSRVWDVILANKIQFRTSSLVNKNSYNLSGKFWKDDTIPPNEVSATNYQWGHIHCAGTTAQRDKGRFGTTFSRTTVGISGTDFTISSATYDINGTIYPVRGHLWVPTSVGNSVDIVVCYHGTLEQTGTTTIADASLRLRGIMKDDVKINDKIIFSVAYPQDHISVTRNINMLTQGQLDSLYFGDNIIYARAALLWAKNSLNALLTSQGLNQQINKVYLFGHSQGGSIVHKLNTIETTDGVVANAPGPIRLDETCAAAAGGTNTTCNKLSALGSPTSTPLSSNPYYVRSVANFVTGHISKVTYLQALGDTTGSGPGLKGQIIWMSELMQTLSSNNQSYEYFTVPTGGHAAFETDQVLQGVIRNAVGSRAPAYESKSDSVNIFNNGKHVDVIVVDDGVSFDCQEWFSPSTNTTRFVQYQWFNQLNSVVTGLNDLDGETLPTGNITYYFNQTNPTFHGVHVTGTICGKHYGWANEANIYNLSGVTSAWPEGTFIDSLLLYDYLRAFHRTKPVNPITGMKNPTITNHSYTSIYFMPVKAGNVNRLDLSDVTSFTHRGTTYTSASLGANWNITYIEQNFGIRFGQEVETYPAWVAAVVADVQDTIADGVVFVGAAGNDHMMIASPGDQDWNNTITITGVGTIYYNRGASPNTPDSGSIIVGSLSNYPQFHKAIYSNFGPGLDIFAPGDDILSAFNSEGFADSKYGGAPNYFYPISGTSMASPQVAGVLALAASGKARFNQDDARGYLKSTALSGNMTFDLGIDNTYTLNSSITGTFLDRTARKNSPNLYLLAKDTRPTSGYIDQQKGSRKTSGVTFPRRNTFNVA